MVSGRVVISVSVVLDKRKARIKTRTTVRIKRIKKKDKIVIRIDTENKAENSYNKECARNVQLASFHMFCSQK